MNRLKNISENSKLKKEDKKNKDKIKIKNPKVKKYILFLLIIAIIIFAIKTAISVRRWQELALEMVQNKSSQVIDTDGKTIAKVGSERNRKNISFKEIPKDLKNAYVAIEDERFYKHHGVDVKRTTAAIGSYVIHLGNASFGASTITQQLVKNLTGDDSASISRKTKEWAKAVELEWCMSKDEILETYLNIIYVGPNLYGVETGAKYYFDKSVSDLSLAECAFLAGINNAPNAYNPFNKEKDNTEKIEKRSKAVLSKMLELGNITEDEYKDAVDEVNDGLKFKKGKIEPDSDGVYSYHTDALISETIADLSKEKKISQTFATNYLYMANLKIYSTQKSSIQTELETEFKKEKYKLKSSDNSNNSQAAMVIIDHKTGEVLGCVGGLGEKKEARGFNRATQGIRQTGSSSKPLTVLIPGLDKKIITPITSYDDEATTFIDENNEEYAPTDYNNYLGEITVRRAVESSQNIPFVKMMEQITPKTSMKYLKKMGITTLGERDENLALALGGLDKGISPLEMAGAYATIANDGVYIEPIFYTKITTNSGKDVLKNKQTTRRVFSKEVAYVTKQLLTQPVEGSNGTAKYCTIPGMEVAAKTGTTNEDYDRWLCGFTNYYTAVTWFGFDKSESIRYNRKNPAGIIWSNVMVRIHTKLKNSDFEKPKGVIAQKICRKSLKIANSGCTDVYTEYFLKGTEPELCTAHSGNKLNSVTDDDTKQKIKNTIKDTLEKIEDDIEQEDFDIEDEVTEEDSGETQSSNEDEEDIETEEDEVTNLENQESEEEDLVSDTNETDEENEM